MDRTAEQKHARGKGRIFEENIQMKQKLERMKKSLDDISVDTMDDLNDASDKKYRWIDIRKCKLRPALICVLVAMMIAIVAVYLLVANYSLSTSSISAVVSANGKASASKSSPAKTPCSGSQASKTFPDIDYALFGYNIIRGYPMAVGHDPGLTRPIFKSDYTGKQLTADCRYNLPRGFTVVPDISCVTSFTSETIQDQYQLTKSLSVSAEVSGEGWGAAFSASAEYKQKSSEVGSKETVYVNAQAHCDYYLSMLDDVQPPPLSKSFIMKVKALKNKSDVFHFFDYYGTHYLKEVTFGARLIYENKLSKSSFQSLSESSSSVSMSASYSGLFRVEGSASLNDQEKKQANEFRQKAETSTISVGAPPPPNGSTSQWASEVKDNPVPTKYKMAGIEELFTKKFMEGTGIDYKATFKLVNGAKSSYCRYLKQKGVVDSCEALQSYTRFKGLKLGASQFSTINADERMCIKSCIQEKECVALTYTNGKCAMFDDKKEHTAEQAKGSVLVLFIDGLSIRDGSLKIKNVYLEATARVEDERADSAACKEKCRKDKKCIVYTSPLVGNKCKLYQQLSITEDSIKFKASNDHGGSFLEFQTNKTMT